MPNAKKWLIEAAQLCASIGEEDGIDPRYLSKQLNSKANGHKTQQLCKKAKQTLSVVLAGEVKDNNLQNLEVIDVSSSDDGQFLIAVIAIVPQELSTDESLILEKLQSIQGYLRSAIAGSVKRKRIPALKFRYVRTYKEDSYYAYSKDNN